MNVPSAPREVLHKMINFGGLEKKMFCSRCNRVTDHVTVTRGEYADMRRWGPFGKFLGKVIDLTPGTGFVVGTPTVCCVCGRLLERGGLFADSP